MSTSEPCTGTGTGTPTPHQHRTTPHDTTHTTHRACTPPHARASARYGIASHSIARHCTGERAYEQSGMPAGGRGCQRAGGHMRASRQASMQASGRDSAPARRSEWASRQARGALPPCRLRPARTDQTDSCRAGPVRRDGGCSCAGPATRLSRTLRVSCEKLIAAACRRVHVCRSSPCGSAGRRLTAPEHETRVAGSSARARLVVVTARHGCIAASCACTLHSQGPSDDRGASRLRVSSATSAHQRVRDKAKMGDHGVKLIGKMHRE